MDVDQSKDDTDDSEAGNGQDAEDKSPVASGGSRQTASGQKNKIKLKPVIQPAAKSAKTGLNPKVKGRKKVKPSVAPMKVFPNELESQVNAYLF